MDEPAFIDAESPYSSNKTDGFGFKNILMRHLERITRSSAVEFRGGYEERKAIPIGNTIMEQQTYVPDSREVYCNSVQMLADLLYPRYDDDIKTKEKEIITKIEELDENDSDYKYEKLKLIKKLFRELSCFLYREKYLEVGKLED
jgi:hypothetical protein